MRIMEGIQVERHAGARVAAMTLGCKVNQYDTNAMLDALRRAGFEVVSWEDQADVRLVNTCTVTAVADSKSRHMIRRASRDGSKVVVCGCLAQRDADKVEAIEGVGAVVRMPDRANIAEIVRRMLGEDAGAGGPAMFGVEDAGERTRGVLKIQEGCSNYCTYCIIPHVRGNPTSRPEEDIVREAERMARKGVREVVVTGIHICSYGLDTGEDLVGLLQRLDRVQGIGRIRLGSLEPGFLEEETVRAAAGMRHLCPHFHVSLQSGCAGTLRAMGRRYTPNEYAAGVALLRRHFDNPAISTDIMTGFPGETEADFTEGMRFVEEMRFARCHVFPYSERGGTPAATMPGAVPPVERRERARRMIQACGAAQREYMAQFLGTAQPVLLDKRERDALSGYTDRYVRVRVPDGPLGDIVRVRLEKAGPDALMGTVTA